MTIKLLAISLAVLLFLFVIELIRREKMTFKYGFPWMVLSLVATGLIVFDRVLFDLAHFFGFELMSNFIFFSLLGVFVFVTLLMTIFLCQQNNRNDIMAQRIAFLESELKALKKNKR